VTTQTAAAKRRRTRRSRAAQTEAAPAVEATEAAAAEAQTDAVEAEATTPEPEAAAEAPKSERKMLPIALTFKVDVDVDAWNAEYGNEDAAADVRNQIREQMLDAAKQSVAHLPETTIRVYR